jgi:lipoprotein-anchoring transpeptidase ErfK/SrfK
MPRLFQPFRDNAALAWGMLGTTLVLLAGSGALIASTATIRFQRDVSRLAFNRNWDALEELKRQGSGVADSAGSVASSATAGPPADKPYIVVSIADRRLWYKKGDSTLFTTQVAVGTGKTLIQTSAGRQEFKFDTPRGRLVVQRKEIAPQWIPPDWHFLEVAKKKGLGVVHLNRGQSIPAPGGGVITVVGNNVVHQFPDGHIVPYEYTEGREIIANGNIVVPPYGTNQRKYDAVLGTHRLDLGDGYGLHGTNEPNSIGHAASHGCVRLRNEDIAYLFNLVDVGTPVFIY